MLQTTLHTLAFHPGTCMAGLKISIAGNTLMCTTDCAEAADAIWRERRAWLQRFPASRLLLRWEGAEEGTVQLICDG
jgi:hypothetical protein